MANTLSPIITKVLGRFMLSLRGHTVMPMFVNNSFSADAKQKGETVDITVGSALSVTDVSPGATPITPSDSAPTTVPITLNNWKHVAIHLKDDELHKIDKDAMFMPVQMASAATAMGDSINDSIFLATKKFYGYAGVAGTTPFASSEQEFLDANLVLEQQLCPKGDRFCVIDPFAEAKALKLGVFKDVSQSGDPNLIREAIIGRKLGATWAQDQRVPLHTAGTSSGHLINNGGGYAAGTKTVTVDTGSGTMLVGDIITFAGVTGTYVVTSALAANSVSFEPGLAGAVADNAAITVKASHRLNSVFHRDAIGFASRPMGSEMDKLLAGQVFPFIDPVTKMAFRVEVIRQNKQWVWDIDCLWGVDCIRREFGCRIAG